MGFPILVRWRLYIESGPWLLRQPDQQPCKWPCEINRSFLLLTHWGRVTHICVGNLTIIGSDNGLSPGRRQAISWTNAGLLLIGPLGTNFSEILFGIQTFSFKKMQFKLSSAKWRPFCFGLNVLRVVSATCAFPVLRERRMCKYILRFFSKMKSSWYALNPHYIKILFTDLSTFLEYTYKIYWLLALTRYAPMLINSSFTYWDRYKMTTIFQTTFSTGFAWMKMYESGLKFHWSLFLGVQLTIFHHWFR